MKENLFIQPLRLFNMAHGLRPVVLSGNTVKDLSNNKDQELP